MIPEERKALRAGVFAAAPLLFGMVPWGVVAGVAMTATGFSAAQAIAMSLAVFAGSAQLAVLPLVVAGAPSGVILATALVVNLRYAVYSAALAPHFASLSRAWRLFLSYLTVDGMFALFIARSRAGKPDPQAHWFYLGGSLLLWSAWQIATAVGVFAGARIPKAWSLEFASTLGLIALLIPLLHDRAAVAGAIVAAATALFAARLPMNLGLLAGVAAGVVAGVAASRLAPSKRAEDARR